MAEAPEDDENTPDAAGGGEGEAAPAPEPRKAKAEAVAAAEGGGEGEEAPKKKKKKKKKTRLEGEGDVVEEEAAGGRPADLRHLHRARLHQPQPRLPPGRQQPRPAAVHAGRRARRWSPASSGTRRPVHRRAAQEPRHRGPPRAGVPDLAPDLPPDADVPDGAKFGTVDPRVQRRRALPHAVRRRPLLLGSLTGGEHAFMFTRAPPTGMTAATSTSRTPSIASCARASACTSSCRRSCR